jgi:predicted O-methyltransferase YrrM
MAHVQQAEFEDTMATIADVEGWLTDGQARRLWEGAASVNPGGTITEIGSYRGRSAIVLARAAGGRATVVAIDPHAGNDRGEWQFNGTREAGESDFEALRDNLRRAGVEEHVRHVRLPSQRALGAVQESVDLLYIDGSHRYGPARADIVRWGERVNPGGRMYIHDAFASVGVTLAQLRVLVFGRDFVYRGRTGSLVEYERAGGRLRGRAWAANVARQAGELPWFVRNVLVKVALLIRARPLARVLGHHAEHGPY